MIEKPNPVGQADGTRRENKRNLVLAKAAMSSTLARGGLAPKKRRIKERNRAGKNSRPYKMKLGEEPGVPVSFFPKPAAQPTTP